MAMLHLAALLLGSTPVVAAASPAPVQAPAYDSAFAGYRNYQEPKLVPWKETNARIAAPAGADPHAAHRAKPATPEAAPARPAQPEHQHKHQH